MRKEIKQIRTLNDICNMIELQPEIKEKVMAFDKDYDYTHILQSMDKLFSRDSWETGLQEIQEVLGNDENGIKILACMLKCATQTYEMYTEKGINQDIFIASLKCFTRFINEHMVSYGTYGFDRYRWTPRQLAMQLLRIGELEYEMITTDEGKEISLHIPSDSVMTTDKLKESFDQAHEFLMQYFPEYAVAKITCHSWLLSPNLKYILPENSKILQFQKLFTILKTDENNDILEWVFKNPKLTIDQLPEDTSLQKNMKAYLQQGGIIGTAYGELVKKPLNKK